MRRAIGKSCSKVNYDETDHGNNSGAPDSASPAMVKPYYDDRRRTWSQKRTRIKFKEVKGRRKTRTEEKKRKERRKPMEWADEMRVDL